MRAALIERRDCYQIQIPREMIEEACLGKKLDIEILDGALIIRAAKSIRSGWEDAVAACHNAGDDCLKDWDSDVDNLWDLSH